MRNETKTSAAMFDQPLPARVLEQSRIVRTSLARRKQVRDLRFIRKLAVTETQGHRLPELEQEDPMTGASVAKPIRHYSSRTCAVLTPEMLRFAVESPLSLQEVATMLGTSDKSIRRARKAAKVAPPLKLKRLVCAGVFLGHELVATPTAEVKDAVA